MHDIEIVTPFCYISPKYEERAVNFPKYGLVNLQNQTVLMTILLGTDGSNHNPENYNWPNNVTVNIIRSGFAQESAKTYDYFSKTGVKSRWIAKFDDDSITDVDGLVKNLDLYYDCEREYYLATCLAVEEQDVESSILHDMGYTYWFGNPLYHEIEGCVISQKTLQAIANNKNAVELMSRRSFVERGYSDLCLAYAARICKIYPIHAYFLSSDPLLADLSVFGGKINHIHRVKGDVVSLFCGMGQETPEVNNFVYFSGTDRYNIILRNDGIIEGGGRARIWKWSPKALYFFNNDGSELCVFDKTNKEFNKEGCLIKSNCGMFSLLTDDLLFCKYRLNKKF